MLADVTAYLGIDLGTSGLKLVLLGADGSVVAEADQAYDVRASLPGHAETDPHEWESALSSALGRLAASAPGVDIVSTGVAGQMHGVVLADSSGEPVRPAMLWPDRRAASVLPRWTSLPEEARGRLSNPLVPGMAGPMLTWLHEHEPAVLESAAVVQSPKDWLRGRMTGDQGTERSDASATLLWDVTADSWSPDALSLAGIGSGALPTVTSSSGVVGEARPLGATACLVVAGAADTAAALLALETSGAAGSWAGGVVVNAGTGIQVVRPDASPVARVDPVTHLYADAAQGWYEMLALQNGGFALTWAHRVLGVSWEQSVALASGAAPGSGGAVFAPFLTGERGAVAPPGASAGWTGLTTSTGRAEMVRAAFEAYAFMVRRGVELVGAGTGPVLLSGGGGRDPWVRQLLADVLGRPITYVTLRSASAVGAALLAARGVGAAPAVLAPAVEVEPSGATDREALTSAYERWLDAASAPSSVEL